MKSLLFIIAFTLTSHSLACSFALMIEEFKLEDVEAPVPAKPEFIVKNIKRGSYDGDGGSCSDAGALTFKAHNGSASEVGYLFKIIEGSFEDEIFYDTPITPSKFAEKGVFTFIWFDGHSDEQKPIDMVVEVTPVSKAGEKGEPAYLEVTHPGVKKPWWKLW